MKSRYSTVTISSSGYSTNIYPPASLKNDGTYTQGYIFVPYIISNTGGIIFDEEYQRKLLKEERKEERIKKLNKLNEL